MTNEHTTGPRGVLHRLRKHFSRFKRNRDGSTAIEFTMLAIPFSMLVFAILESCISFAAQEVLANTTDDIARQFRTGQILEADVTEADLRKRICDRLSIIVAKGCPDLYVDLKQYETFDLASKVKIKFTSNGDLDTGGFVVAPGKSETKNMLRVFYKWPVITDFMRKSMSNLPGSKTLHFATSTWQNEPFND